MKKKGNLKKLILSCCFGLLVSVSTAGCNSIVMDAKPVSYQEIASSVAKSESAAETSQEGVRLNYTDNERNQQVPNYFQQNMEEKFKELGGRPAFRIKNGHSDDSSDIEEFQIVDLIEDNTFVYGYVTCMESAEDEIVHCAAMHNYKTGTLEVFHEKIFRRSGDIKGDNESFYVQTSGNEIFVYDNGVAYLYGTSGVLKSQSNVEQYLRDLYPDAYSITVANALTDGNSRVYLEVSVEHQEVKMDDTVDNSDKTEEELDEEAEALDKEVSSKVSDFILVYEVTPITSYMYQDNTKFTEQKNAWIDMTKGKEFTSAPSATGDWNTVVNSIKDNWGGAYIWFGSGSERKTLSVYQWKGKPKFYLDDKIQSFLAFAGAYKNYTALEANANTRDKGLFIPVNDNYSILNGTLASTLEKSSMQTLKRTYTLVKEEQITNSDGTTTTLKASMNVTQTMTVYSSRYRKFKNNVAFTETYRILDPDKVDILGNCVDGRVLCAGGRKFYWAEPDGTLTEICKMDDEGYLGGILKEGSSLYLVASGENKVYITPIDKDGEADLLDGDVLFFTDLGGGYEPGNSVYDNAFERTAAGIGNDLYGGAEFYTEKNVLIEPLYVNPTLAKELNRAGSTVLGMSEGGMCYGYLLTSMNRGLIYQNPAKLEGAVLVEGCWYRSFNNGSKIVSVGFANGDNSYSSMDMAFARVYEYDLNTICKEVMEGAIKEIERAAEEAKNESSGEGLLESETETETVKSMQEHWSEEYQDKYTEVAPETAMSAGETFDSESFAAEEESRQAEAEESRAARIDEIIGNTSGSGN